MLTVPNNRLLVITFGAEAPSTHYRWLVYEPKFREAGWSVEFKQLSEIADWAALDEFDVVVLQKTMVSGAVFHSIRKHSKRLVYDADDRIWMRSGKPYRGWTKWKIHRRMRMIAAGVDRCLAANSFIAEDLKMFGAEPVVIPMGLDPAEWVYQPTESAYPKIGWTGGPKNLPFLEAILPAIQSVMEQHAVSFQIHCGEDPQFADTNYQYMPFIVGQESQVVRGFDIGLCPLPNDPFSCGKSPIKSLQYLASGAAVVASPQGAVQDMITDGETGLWAGSIEEWETQVVRLVKDANLRHSLSTRGREFMLERFSADKVFHRLLSVLESLIV